METSAANGLPRNLPVLVSVLGGSETIVTGYIVGLSGTNMCLKTARALPAGRPVKVKAEDTLWLAEVRHCEQAEGEYIVALDVAHALYGLGDLARLAERLLDKPGLVQSRTPAPELRYV